MKQCGPPKSVVPHTGAKGSFKKYKHLNIDISETFSRPVGPVMGQIFETGTIP